MLIAIGQFSKMSRLSIKALRLYADNGLLPPAYVDPDSGYRYYRPEQARRAEIIRILRSVEMPLEEIGAILNAQNGESTDQLLQDHHQRLSERLAAQQRMLLYLESIIQNQERIMPYEITLETAEARLIAGVTIRTNLKRIANDMQTGFGQLMQGLMQHRCETVGPPMSIYYDVLDEDNEGSVGICTPVSAAVTGNDNFHSKELPGGRIVTTVHHGPYEELSSAYHSVFAWMAEQGHELSDAPREIYLNDPRTVSPQELLTKLEFPIAAV